MNNHLSKRENIYIIVIGKKWRPRNGFKYMDNLAPYEEWELVLNFNAMFLLTNSIMVRKV